MLYARKRNRCKFSGSQIEDINRSLLYKAKYGSWLNSENNSGAKNRYQRLLHKINGELPKETLQNDSTYSLELSWFDRRSLRGALRFVMKKQDFLLQKREEQKSTDEHIEAEGRVAPKNKIREISKAEKHRLAGLALRNAFLLGELGYLNQTPEIHPRLAFNEQ